MTICKAFNGAAPIKYLRDDYNVPHQSKAVKTVKAARQQRGCFPFHRKGWGLKLSKVALPVINHSINQQIICNAISRL